MQALVKQLPEDRDFVLSAFLRMEMPVPNAFESLIRFGVTKQFPKLRFGFVEAGATTITLRLVGYDQERQYDLVTNRVLPQFLGVRV